MAVKENFYIRNLHDVHLIYLLVHEITKIPQSLGSSATVATRLIVKNATTWWDNLKLKSTAHVT